MKKILFLCLALLAALGIYGQATAVVKAEYFFDTDPGVGNGMELPIGSPGENIIFAGEINTTGLPEGFHWLYIRTQDDLGKWSLTEGRTFYITGSLPGAPPVSTEITAAEYFFDTDPGVGNGTELPIGLSAENISFAGEINTTGLAEGFHRLYIRTQDDLGKWSLTEGRTFYITGSLPEAPPVSTEITAAEYFFDTDPGVGNGIAIDIPVPAASINAIIDISTLDMPIGDHYLYIRTRDDLGKWSLTERHLFTNTCPEISISGGTLICLSSSTTLTATVTGNNLVCDIQWEESTDGVNFTAISGANALTYEASPSVTTYYRAAYSCTESGCQLTSGTEMVEISSSAVTYYADTDEDGYGDPADTQLACEQPAGYVINSDDCDDSNNAIHPGATEICNGLDDNCDGFIDEGVLVTYFADADGDGYGAPETSNIVPSCTAPIGYVANSDDCDDSNTAINPEGQEICNGLDDNCDGLVDDDDPDLDPSGRSTWYADADSDGFGDAGLSLMACNQPAGYVDNADDCDDTNASINPGAAEICNGIDDNCDGLVDDGDPAVTAQPTWYADADSDGFGDANDLLQACTQPEGYVVNDDDCDDTNPTVYALDCNGDCGGTVVDNDGDGICGDVDCDDTDPDVATQPGDACDDGDNTTINDTLDGDCNCVGTPTACTGIGDADNDGVCSDVDCDDNDPNASFIDCNGVCGGTVVDNDGDGICSDVDCDDNNENVQGPPSQSPSGLLPASGSSDLDNKVLVSWQPVPYANRYDIYFWDSNNPEPSNPTVSNLTAINFLFSNLGYGKTYNWKVIARINTCPSPPSVTQSFTIRDLPDLQFSGLQTPATVFSGQQISLDWIVENTGIGSTFGQFWSDVFYLSEDEIFNDLTDPILGSVANFSALDPGESYTNTATFTVPQGIEGVYKILAYTDRFSKELESNENNNTFIQTVNVNLTPPPDLQVTSVVVPPNKLSGEYIGVSWTVTNEGPGSTLVDEWEDRLYLSEETIFDPSSTIYLGKKKIEGALLPGESYTGTAAVQLPQFIGGTYYVHAVTDYKNDVYESALETNNTNFSNPIEIHMVTPPDLIVSEITAPDVASNNEGIYISWTVINQTNTPTNEDFWGDRVYISPTATFDANTALKLGLDPYAYHRGILGYEESYTGQILAGIPKNINGSWFIIVIADAFNSIDEFTFENNNNLAVPIEIISPDLAPANISHASNAFSGELFQVQWDAQNLGPGMTNYREWETHFYLSTDDVLDLDLDILVDSVASSGAIGNGALMPEQYDIFIPNGLDGTYHLFLFIDSDEQIFENGYEANNLVLSSIPIDITLSQWADLQVSNIQAPDMIVAGFPFSIDYSVTNAGLVDTKDSVWVDRVYLSPSSIWDSSEVVFLGSITQYGKIAANGSHSRSTFVKSPVNLSEGDYFLHIFTDATDREYEHTDEGNNISSTPVYVQPYPPVDLAVSSATGPSTAFSGTIITVQWTVQNIGEAATVTTQWYDKVYLSADPTLGSGDLLLITQLRNSALESDSSYNWSKSISIPNGLSGDYYLIVVADQTQAVVEDVDRSNNVLVLNNGEPISISLLPPPDLIISSIVTPVQITAGQPFSLIYTVENIGVGNTRVISWNDKFFLSPDLTYTYLVDRQIGVNIHGWRLAPGESYTDTVEITIPVSYSGNYYILAYTDANNQVYEHLQESNNGYSLPITIEQPPPSDLLVTSITLQDTAIAGEATLIRWKLANEGINVASGIMSEAIYLSRDPQWDINDPLIGTIKRNINLPPGLSYSLYLNADLTGVSMGDYYAIIRTDILDNIYESDETNNVRVSESTIHVDVKTLEMGVPAEDVLTDYKTLYYKIEVPSSLFEESMVVSLKGDSINGYNELYIRYNEVPTRVEYDEAYEVPFYGNQEVIVSSLLPGTYYLLVFGENIEVAHVTEGEQVVHVAIDTQGITLLAEILNFEIRNIDADEGGNTGSVTVELKGAKFDEAMVIRLGNALGDTITAGNVNLFDPTLAYVTFDLLGAEPGLYNVIGINGVGDTAIVTDGFEVLEGGEPSLRTIVSHPQSVPRRRIVTFEIAFVNDGTVDIIDPVAHLVSMAGAPVSLTQPGISENLLELDLILEEFNGPPGILRPGAGGVITVYTKSIAPLGFLVSY